MAAMAMSLDSFSANVQKGALEDVATKLLVSQTAGSVHWPVLREHMCVAPSALIASHTIFKSLERKTSQTSKFPSSDSSSQSAVSLFSVLFFS